MIFFVYLLLCIFVLFSLILFQLLRHNYTIANSFEAIEAQSKIPLRWVFFTANIPQPDEIAKQNADVFPSYLTPRTKRFSRTKKKYTNVKQEHKRWLSIPEASGRNRESKSSVSLWWQLTNVELKGACTTMLEKKIIIKTDISPWKMDVKVLDSSGSKLVTISTLRSRTRDSFLLS